MPKTPISSPKTPVHLPKTPHVSPYAYEYQARSWKSSGRQNYDNLPYMEEVFHESLWADPAGSLPTSSPGYSIEGNRCVYCISYVFSDVLTYV